eukprot:tig00001307_g8119.t1
MVALTLGPAMTSGSRSGHRARLPWLAGRTTPPHTAKQLQDAEGRRQQLLEALTANPRQPGVPLLHPRAIAEAEPWSGDGEFHEGGEAAGAADAEEPVPWERADPGAPTYRLVTRRPAPWDGRYVALVDVLTAVRNARHTLTIVDTAAGPGAWLGTAWAAGGGGRRAGRLARCRRCCLADNARPASGPGPPRPRAPAADGPLPRRASTRGSTSCCKVRAVAEEDGVLNATGALPGAPGPPRRPLLPPPTLPTPAPAVGQAGRRGGGAGGAGYGLAGLLDRVPEARPVDLLLLDAGGREAEVLLRAAAPLQARVRLFDVEGAAESASPFGPLRCAGPGLQSYVNPALFEPGDILY